MSKNANIAVAATKVEVPAQNTELVVVAQSARKLPGKLSKSMLVSLMHDAGFSIKQMVAASPQMLADNIIPDAFVEGHCRNSVRDFTNNPHKAANARLVAESIKFTLPEPAVIVTLNTKASMAAAAQAVAPTTASAPSKSTK